MTPETMASAIVGAEVMRLALEIPLPELQECARIARAEVTRVETLTPILAHQHSLGAINATLDALRAAARAAEALLDFRRVLEEVRAPSPEEARP